MSSRKDKKKATTKSKGIKSLSKATTITMKDEVTAAKEKKSNRGRVKGEGKGKTTGFNIFRSEYLSSNPPPLTKTAASTNETTEIATTMKNGKPTKSHNVQFVTNTKLAGSKWKTMSEEEKAPYKEKARIRNEKLISSSTTSYYSIN